MILGMICGGAVKAAGDALSHALPHASNAWRLLTPLLVCFLSREGQTNSMPSCFVVSMHPVESSAHAEQLAQQTPAHVKELFSKSCVRAKQ